MANIFKIKKALSTCLPVIFHSDSIISLCYQNSYIKPKTTMRVLHTEYTLILQIDKMILDKQSLIRKIKIRFKMNLILLILNLVLSASMASLDTDCLQKITWSTDNNVLEVSTTYSYIDCFTKCIKNQDCISNTWYGEGQNTRLQNICVLFNYIPSYDKGHACTGNTYLFTYVQIF